MRRAARASLAHGGGALSTHAVRSVPSQVLLARKILRDAADTYDSSLITMVNTRSIVNVVLAKQLKFARSLGRKGVANAKLCEEMVHLVEKDLASLRARRALFRQSEFLREAAGRERRNHYSYERHRSGNSLGVAVGQHRGPSGNRAHARSERHVPLQAVAVNKALAVTSGIELEVASAQPSSTHQARIKGLAK